MNCPHCQNDIYGGLAQPKEVACFYCNRQLADGDIRHTVTGYLKDSDKKVTAYMCRRCELSLEKR